MKSSRESHGTSLSKSHRFANSSCHTELEVEIVHTVNDGSVIAMGCRKYPLADGGTHYHEQVPKPVSKWVLKLQTQMKS